MINIINILVCIDSSGLTCRPALSPVGLSTDNRRLLLPCLCTLKTIDWPSATLLGATAFNPARRLLRPLKQQRHYSIAVVFYMAAPPPMLMTTKVVSAGAIQIVTNYVSPLASLYIS